MNKQTARNAGTAGPLQSIRIQAGLSQTELSQKARVPQALLSAYERGRLRPSQPMATLIAEKLGVPVETAFPYFASLRKERMGRFRQPAPEVKS